MSLRRVPIYRVLWRGNLFLGAEREPALMLVVIAIALVMLGQNLPSLISGVSLWLTGMPALRWMAKHDEVFSKVYFRQLKHQRYYPARSRPYRTT